MIIAVGDDKKTLNDLKRIIDEIRPDEDMKCFFNAEPAIACAMEAACEIAFVEMDLKGSGGYYLAEQLKRIHPKINLILLSQKHEDAEIAFELRASGFQIKPYTKEKIIYEIENLRFQSVC